MIDRDTDKAEATSEAWKTRIALTSSLILARETGQSINMTRKQVDNIESEVTENQRAVLDERLSRLQKAKEALEIPYKTAQMFGEQFKKMKDSAIRRFAEGV